MRAQIKNVETFIKDEKAYHTEFKTDVMDELAKRLNITLACNGWISARGEVVNVNVDSTLRNELMDHMYSFMLGRRLVWAACPYGTVEHISRLLKTRGIKPMAITENTPYGDLLVLLDPIAFTAVAYVSEN